MNAERLNSICLKLKRETDAINIRDKLAQLIQNLELMINQPQQQAQFQNQINNILTDLHNSLLKADSNKFSPAWRQSIEEIGGQNLLGEVLYTRIKEVFERNQITIAVALKDMKRLNWNSINLRMESIAQLMDLIY